MFPERASSGDVTYFAGHFPEVVVGASAPQTVGALILESGSTMTIRWASGIAFSSTDFERRSNLVDDPVLEFTGTALVAGATGRVTRTQMAQYAALGETFSLGLPWEALAVDDEAVGNTVSVPSTVNIDWVAVGVRVLVTHANGVLESFIVSFTADSITLNDAVGIIGDLGAEIMPVIQVLLDPEQTILRYSGDGQDAVEGNEDDVERWQIKAVAAVPGIVAAALYAELELSSVGGSGVMDDVVITAPQIGASGNLLTVTFVGDGGGLDYVETSGNALTYHFTPGVTTVGEMIGRIERSDFVVVTGPRTTDLLASGDAFGPVALAGGVDQLPVEMGQGITLATFAGSDAVARAVWDQPVVVQTTAQDSIQTRAPLTEIGYGRFAASAGSRLAWGRQMSIKQEIIEQWQWIKKFLWTVRGSWKKFWLPTWRNDLRWLESNTGTITVESGAASGDFFRWYPALRDCIQIEQDTTITYARISAAVDNGDGTITLTIVDASSAPVTLTADEVDRISWLETTRFSNDENSATFEGAQVSFTATGRVVRQ